MLPMEGIGGNGMVIEPDELLEHLHNEAPTPLARVAATTPGRPSGLRSEHACNVRPESARESGGRPIQQHVLARTSPQLFDTA